MSYAVSYYNRYAAQYIRTLKRYFGVSTGTGPAVAPVAAASATAGVVTAGNHQWSYTTVGPDGESAPSPLSNVINADGAHQVNLSAILPGPLGTTSRKVYRTKANAPGASFLLTTIADNTTTVFVDNVADAGLGAAPPANVPIVNCGIVGGRKRVVVANGPAITVGPRPDL